MTEILVRQSDFDLYKPLPKNLDFERLYPYILDAQRRFISDGIGRGQYRDLWQNATDAKYVDLLSGTNYTYCGEDIDFYGIRPAIVWYAYALFIRSNDFRVTRSGNKRKNAQESQDITDSMMAIEQGDAFSNGKRYLQDVQKFLSNNGATYPLYKCGYVPRGSFRLGSAGQKDYYSEL